MFLLETQEGKPDFWNISGLGLCFKFEFKGITERLELITLGGNCFKLFKLNERGERDQLFAVQFLIRPWNAHSLKADIREPGFFHRLRNNYYKNSSGPKVIHMDPPWRIAGKNPHRGLHLPYDLMGSTELLSLDFDAIQDTGILFIWVTNSTRSLAEAFLDKFGYR